MPRPAFALGALLLGANDRQRMRVLQSLLGVPALLLIQALLVLQWQQGRIAGAPVAWYVVLTLAGCAVFYLLVRCGLGERLSQEASLSAPQMMYAMVCVAWGYTLAGPNRAALLCLLPLILCFGIFALQPLAARALSHFGIVLMGAVMAWLAVARPAGHEPLQEAANWAFVAASMAMIRILSDRLGRMRARLSAQKAELTEALERIRLLATRDTLTGLLNRRAAQDELRRASGQAQRADRPLVVALADLDHFKQINDSFGHQVGDRVLQAFARAAERELRGADRVARWGGEEFLFVLPDTDEQQACICLDRLRLAYSGLGVDGVAAGHGLGFSAGVALCTGPDDIDAAIERADRAMYGAKLAGRGRTQGLPPLQ
ncbi:diguanylate cyclase (GGDEF) domain-containing protein [Burkholderiales bacterium JOSHI_001]|nr:diguanylate cyclase (GGDEF) domain-containing protein [Burkholderiales bacterium JOSHI_001]